MTARPLERAAELARAACLEPDHAPLVALLGRAEHLFEAEFDRRLRDTEFPTLSLAHSRNVLRHLAAGPRRASQLVTECDLTKQAISQQIAHLERGGFVRSEPDPTDHRARVLQLTEQGRRAQRLVHELFERIEGDWGEALGAEELAALRGLLVHLLVAVPRPTGSAPGPC